MKNLIYYLLLSIAVLGFSSCDAVKTEKVRSYAISYTNFDSLKLVSTATSNNIKVLASVQTDYVDWKSKGDDKVKYDALCKKHDDMNYFNKISYIARPELGHYFMEDFTSLDVVSNQNFDAAHPAGVSLKDVVRFCSATPAPYIRSGYKTNYDWSILPKGFEMDGELKELIHASKTQKSYDITGLDLKAVYPIDKLLSDLSAADLELAGMGNGNVVGVLIFEKKPDNPALNHRLTVKLTTNAGKLLKTNINYTFK